MRGDVLARLDRDLQGVLHEPALADISRECVGARKRTQLAESLGALDVRLSSADLAAIEKAVPKDAAVGGRYAEAQLAHLDSERKPAA